MTTPAERLAANLSNVRENIASAARSAGRAPESVRLVGVTKYVDVATTRQLFEAGCTDLGESRPQQLWEKAEALKDLPILWHLIGHLQRNKVRRTIGPAALIHSGDSLRLLEELDREAAATKKSQPLPVLLEVNVSGEPAKHGFSLEELPTLGDAIGNFTHLDIRGLMAMAGLNKNPNAARADFAKLRELRDHLRAEWTGRFALDELSMGMSGDYQAAIAEGATIVRVGYALFEGLE